MTMCFPTKEQEIPRNGLPGGRFRIMALPGRLSRSVLALVVLSLLLAASGCHRAEPHAVDTGVPPASTIILLPDSLLQFLTSEGLENGSVVIWDIERDAWYVFNDTLSRMEFSPASTFKVLNSLIALETGIIQGADDTLRWDGTVHNIASWNHDHDLRSAFNNSVVWYYQELARRIGEERILAWLDSADYGNTDISGGIDRFWLDGSLKISPENQVVFINRLRTGSLPFSGQHMALVREIMIHERDSRSVMRAKTGWGFDDNRDIGWLVGYLEDENGDAWVFTTLIIAGEQLPEGFAGSRFDITGKFLRYIRGH